MPANSRWDLIRRLRVNLIYKDECLFVPYTNPHFWTDRNQTLHTSPPWSGRDRRVCMGPQYSTFSTYFAGSRRRFIHTGWRPSPRYTATALYPWCDACWRDVTHGGLCNENAEKWTECVCVKMETWWDGMEMTNELNLQLHCSYKMITYNLSNLRPSFFRSLSTDNTFFSSSQPFPSFQRDVWLTGWQHSAANPDSHVCVCVGIPCLYTFVDLLALFRPLWEMFRERHDNTVIHASHMGNYMLHARQSETLQTFTFRLLKGKQRTSVTFQTDGNIPISLHVFAFLLIVEQDIVFIRDAAFFLHVCAFA